ncbi:type VI secretion system Vgr family protein [Pedobacter caeni]|uniref:Uncharacterized conserved protein, implicated in type VI secretion and phage assembly n=1 Tax=Pedobacter caeni TaxID=288992 RepID=A0A1M5Q0N9_9SPHI|nr:phage baseplate assembly protein V [Pedobacter caeni]SHH07331.1 Uncharacterized conserved protein, implicated in type VI secretion and phage assembly [Pedobacter caeni]
MEKHLIKEINIKDTAISHFSSFTLQQQFNEHHYFELRFNHDQIGAPGLITLESSRDFIGQTLTASFGYATDKMQRFAGIVTKVALTQSNGYHGILVVSGYSPTILIDRGPDLGSYLDKDLETIVRLATHDTPVNDLKIKTNVSRKNVIDYIIQYRETDFNFLNRLSGEYHEWFYYDGENLNFGKPDDQKELNLVYGRDISSLQYGMEVAPVKSKNYAYNPIQNELLAGDTSGKAEGRTDFVHAVKASHTLYSKGFNQASSIRVDNGEDLKNHTENEEKANISELLKINARGDNPELGIGTVAEISMSLRKDLSFVTENLGKFLITSISHTIDERGHYFNVFEGIVSNTERILVKSFDRPNPEMQLADVLDNADPQGMGRIKVKFKWTCKTNDPSAWLRVITPDAGSSEVVSKNRGYVFIPEKGDQVVVSFEGGNLTLPIVMGSVFHGSNGAGGSSANHLKTIATRSGNKITMNDAEGSIKIEDPSGNVVFMDGAGNIDVTAPNNISFNAGQNITLNAGMNISSTAGLSVSESAGVNISHIASGMINQNAGADYSLRARNILKIADESIKSDASSQTKIATKDIQISSLEGNVNKHAQKEIQVNSSEKSTNH